MWFSDFQSNHCGFWTNEVRKKHWWNNNPTPELCGTCGLDNVMLESRNGTRELEFKRLCEFHFLWKTTTVGHNVNYCGHIKSLIFHWRTWTFSYYEPQKSQKAYFKIVRFCNKLAERKYYRKFPALDSRGDRGEADKLTILHQNDAWPSYTSVHSVLLLSRCTSSNDVMCGAKSETYCQNQCRS